MTKTCHFVSRKGKRSYRGGFSICREILLKCLNFYFRWLKIQISNPKLQIPNTKLQISNLKLQIQNNKFQIPNPKLQIVNAWNTLTTF